MTAIARRVREAAGGRSTFVMAENEPQDADLVRPVEEGGSGLNAIWNDDLHHAARVALTGKNEGYFTDYLGSPQELVSAAKWGFLYQGQQYRWHRRRRGKPAFDVPRHRFVTFIENHDQVANSGRGLRVNRLTGPAKLRAVTAYLLLGPGTPMLFQGQEYASTRPFLYFADHNPELARLVHEGRRNELKRFRSQSAPEVLDLVADPADPATCERCQLDPAERAARGEWLALHTDLIALRKSDPALRPGVRLDGAVLSDAAFVLRYFVPDDHDRLLVVNLGRCWPRRSAGWCGRRCGRARTRGTAGTGRPRWTPRTVGGCRARRPCGSPRRRTRRSRSTRRDPHSPGFTPGRPAPAGGRPR